MVDFLCNLAASFFLLPPNVDNWYSFSFILGLLFLFFLVTSATLSSSMSLFRLNYQLLLWWWPSLIPPTRNLIWTSVVDSSSYGVVNFCILAGIMSHNILLLWSCFKLSSVTFNNWSLMLTSPSWSTSCLWLNLRFWSSYDCCSKMSLAFLPFIDSCWWYIWKSVIFHIFATKMIHSPIFILLECYCHTP